jgi:hypothetical protein
VADAAWNPEGLVNGFWHGKAGIAQQLPAGSPA